MNKNHSIPEELHELHEQYKHIPIPEQLDRVVQDAIDEGIKSKIMRERKFCMKKQLRNITFFAATVGVVFVGAAKFSPTFAQSMSQVPILKNIVQVICGDTLDYNEEGYNASLKTPTIQGLENTALEAALNTKYLDENKALFEAFEKEVGQLAALTEDGHLGLDTGYEIKTNTDQILSIGRYVTNTVASSSTTMSFDTIDKVNEVIITLPSLFKNDEYMTEISKNIIEQMKTRRAEDSNVVYWIDGEADAIDGFKEIKADQQFYISEQGNLVICFDKYEVAPGYMGLQEFIIPTEVIQDILVSNDYIK